jgi:hypothetical protein
VISNLPAHQLCACVISAVSTQLVFNLTALYQKNSSNAVLQAVSHVASSEYTGLKLDGVDVSVNVTVNVLYDGAGGSAILKLYSCQFLIALTTL